MRRETAAAVPTTQLVDAYDLSDLLTDAAAPTSGLITITFADAAFEAAAISQKLGKAVKLMGYSQAVFNLTQSVPYNFGLVTQLLNEIYNYNTYNTGSVRNIYSPNVTTAIELMVDQAAKATGQLDRDRLHSRHGQPQSR